MSTIVSHSPLNISETEIEAWFQRTSNRKGPREQIVMRRIMSHTGNPERSSCDPDMFKAQYLKNSWGCYLATVANYSIVCCEAGSMVSYPSGSLASC